MLKLMDLIEMAPPGEQTGVITRVAEETGKDEDGVAFKRLDWHVETTSLDSTGKPFLLKKSYNMNVPRGLTAFRNDFWTWSGKKLSDRDLALFDAENLMKGKPVKFVVRHRKEGKKTVAVIDRFLRTIIPQVES